MRSSGRAVKRTIALAAGIATIAAALGFLVRPFNEKAQYKPVSEYLKERAGPDDRILVWGHVPEIYWASGKRPATRFLTSGFLSGWEPGRPGNDANVKDATPGAWELFFEDFAAHPPTYILDTAYSGIRGAQYYTIARYSCLGAHRVPGLRLRGIGRRHRHLQAARRRATTIAAGNRGPVTSRPQSPSASGSHERPGERVVAGVGVG